MIRLLTDAARRRLLKECDKEIQTLRKAKCVEMFGSSDLETIAKRHGKEYKYNNAEYYLNSWDPTEYMESSPDLESFEGCCGANILFGFGLEDARPSYKLTRLEEIDATLTINNLLDCGKNMIVAILNENQQPLFGPILKSFGGVCHPETALGNTRKRLYLWTFVKKQPRKTKRTF